MTERTCETCEHRRTHSSMPPCNTCDSFGEAVEWTPKPDTITLPRERLRDLIEQVHEHRYDFKHQNDFKTPYADRILAELEEERNG